MTTKIDYYTKDELTTWERIKKAFANDWEQTRADFGSDSARDIHQDIDDTLKQMVGSDDAFENREQAFRFGYIAQNRYKAKYPSWNKDLDTRLKSEFEGDYETNREDIRHAYDYPRSS